MWTIVPRLATIAYILLWIGLPGIERHQKKQAQSKNRDHSLCVVMEGGLMSHIQFAASPKSFHVNHQMVLLIALSIASVYTLFNFIHIAHCIGERTMWMETIQQFGGVGVRVPASQLHTEYLLATAKTQKHIQSCRYKIFVIEFSFRCSTQFVVSRFESRHFAFIPHAPNSIGPKF